MQPPRRRGRGTSRRQPKIRAEAERQGLAFAHVLVVSGAITADDVADFEAALAALPGPVFAYCRSGTRSQNLWKSWPVAEGMMAKPADRASFPPQGRFGKAGDAW